MKKLTEYELKNEKMVCSNLSLKNPILLLVLTLVLISGRCSNDDDIMTPDDPIEQQGDDMGDDSDDTSNDAEEGTFTEVTSITPSGIEEGYFFGFDISATSEFTAVSAPWHDEKGNRVGAVFIFRRNGSAFELTAHTLYPEAPTFEDSFGYSVALDRTTLVVGAPENDKNGENAGLAFIYQHTGNNQWNLVKELEAPNPQENQQFGIAVAIDNGIIAIGSKSDQDNYYDDGGPISPAGGFAEGSVFIYEENNGWEFSQKLIPENEQGDLYDAFGRSLALDGNKLAVGAPGASDLLYDEPGKVYLFEKNGDLWTDQATIEASDAQETDSFGSSLALDGNTLAITAPGSFNSLMPNSNVPHGAAYVFNKVGNDWTEETKLVAADTKPEDNFGGGDIALHSDYLIVGAPLKRVVTDYNGAAYFFNREAGWPESHMITAPNPLNEDLFGSALAATLDMIFVGAHRRCNETGCWAGALYFVQ